MRKAKVVAIVCGMIASCLFGGFAVVEAATITLDDSSADLVMYVEPTTEDTAIAATVTSIETSIAAETRATTAKDAETTTAKNNMETKSQTTTTTVAEDQSKKNAATATTEETSVTVVEIVKKAAAPSAQAVATTAKTTAVTTTTNTTTTTTTTTTTAKATTTKATTAATTAASTEMTAPALSDVTAAVEETQAPATEAPVVEIEAPIEEAAPSYGSAVSVSESDYILLCNAVAHEAGANNIPVTEKAKVVEVIMNRVASASYPGTIYEVLTQKYQFSGSSSYVNLGDYSGKVTDMVKESVDLYLSDPSQFSEGYLSFTGDGVRNYFR